MGIQQGLSGLKAISRSMEVIGNNIANAGTFGAKASRAEFGEIYSASLGAGASHPGAGVQIAQIAQQFRQGDITATGNPLDLSIDGRGFFIMSSDQGEVFYGRNGQFQLDAQGRIANAMGQVLMGSPWDEAVGRASGGPVPMQVSIGGGLAVKTGEGGDPASRGIQLSLNLSASDSKVDAAKAFAIGDSQSYNFSTSQTIYDGQGKPMSMSYYFRKNDNNRWEMHVALDGRALSGNGLPLQMSFASDGKLSSSPSELKLTIPNPAGGEALFTDLPLRLGRITQLAPASSVSELRQDGYPYGDFTGVSFDQDGLLRATYTNGLVKSLYQLRLADFTNVNGLQPVSGNLWVAGPDVGSKTVNAPGGNGTGVIRGGALEASNVDLTAELVNMITAQRLYQANAQTIKTTDQALQALVNLR